MSQIRKLVSKILCESNSFWADSGTVDASYAPLYNFENGKPVTVEGYHMTPHVFTKFKIGEVNAWGRGVYLTNKPEDCSYNPETIKDWNKMRLWATFFKPFVYEDIASKEFIDWIWGEIQNIVDEDVIRDSAISRLKFDHESSYMDMYYRVLFKTTSGVRFKDQSSLSVVNTIKHLDDTFGLHVYEKLGLDGMILPFGKTAMSDNTNKDTVWYICYKTTQIKSYDGNNGNYSLDSDDINESTTLTERLYPQIPDDIYVALLKDTSPNGKANAYTKFFGEYLLSNRLHKDEDIAELTKRHSVLRQAGLVRPINEYEDIFELIHDLDKHADYETNSEQRKLAKADAKIVGEVNGYKLYEITSYKASKYYGAGTKWCTTSATSRHYYDSYKTKRGDNGWRKLIYAINDDDKKFALTISRSVSDSFFSALLSVYNAADDDIGMYGVQGDKKYNPLTKKFYVNYNEIMNYYTVREEEDEEITRALMDWAISKYKLSKDILEKEFRKQFSAEELEEDVQGKFFEYSNTDDKAIGICGLNRQAAQNDSYTMIVDMSPQEFLSLSAAHWDKLNIEWFEDQIEKGVPMAMPFLEIEIENPKNKIARVYGHEGRHRSSAVSNLGYTNAQCILFIRDFIRNGYKKEDLVGWTILGQKSHHLNKNKDTHENNSFLIKSVA